MSDMTINDHDHRADRSFAGGGSGSYVLANVRAVLGQSILDDAVITVDGGVITGVESGVARPAGSIDGHRLLCLPGIVDTHSDGLEKEIAPRRTVQFPIDYAVASFESRVRAAGVTTVFHGLSYQDNGRLGRSVRWAKDMYDAVEARRMGGAAAVDHRVLYRIEARDETAVGPLFDDLGAGRTAGLAAVPVSFEDHTPGQGQYRDAQTYVKAIDPNDLPGGLGPEEFVAQLMADAEGRLAVRDANLARLGALARNGGAILQAHDAEHEADIAVAAGAGATVAEFPLTVEAARAARELGMAVVMGAPNALRGGSHSGNVSARELVQAGLCDVVASDYMPTAMLAAAFVMANDGLCSLATAISLITAGPAAMTGLHDRGRLEPGARADMVLVDDRGAWPQVVTVNRADDPPCFTVLG